MLCTQALKQEAFVYDLNVYVLIKNEMKARTYTESYNHLLDISACCVIHIQDTPSQEYD